jgi:DnaJ domain
MDPYRTLGVDRTCTREEVKAAFRAKVQLAHPDRGGDEQAFIHFVSAYKQILMEIPPSPIAPKPARSAPGSRDPRRPAPKEQPSKDLPRKPDRRERPSKSPDAKWYPDLVLEADVGRDGKPAPLPDPTWLPDLVLHDEPGSHNQPVQPLDPHWRPAVVFLDETSKTCSAQPNSMARPAPAEYRSFFKRISDRSSDESVVDWHNPWVRTIGLLIFAAIIAGNIWLCWIAWYADLDATARQTMERETRAR